MPDTATLSAGCILASLVLYALFGGADFGGGFWDLLARGPRAADRRRLIAKAIGPVWETNHIWIIVAIVILFTAFPVAFAVVCTTLFIPLTIVLAGIVLRGAAFAFHAYRLHEKPYGGTVGGRLRLGQPRHTGLPRGRVRGDLHREDTRDGPVGVHGRRDVVALPFPCLRRVPRAGLLCLPRRRRTSSSKRTTRGCGRRSAGTPSGPPPRSFSSPG